MSEWTVKVDGVPTSVVATEDATHTSLYFECDDGSHSVEIVGTKVVGNPWDFNGDGIVDMKDIILIILHYGTVEGEPGWVPIYDINGDGVVDMRDIFIVILHFGET